MKRITSWQVSILVLLLAALALLAVACRSESLEEEVPPGLNDTTVPQGEIPVENVAPAGEVPVEQQPIDQPPPVEQQPAEQQPAYEPAANEVAPEQQDVPDLVDPNAGQGDPNAGQAGAPPPPSDQQQQQAAPPQDAAAPPEQQPAEQQPAPVVSENRTHVVRPRDTLGEIADYYEVSIDTVMAANGLPDYIIYPEQVLIIPPPDGSYVPPPEEAPQTEVDPSLGTVHVVQPGQTISQIAEQYNMSYLDLAAYNAIPDPYYINAGQELIIPNNR